MKGKTQKLTDTKRYSVDSMMRNVASSLVRDFQASFDDPCYCSDFLTEVRVGSIARVRELVPAVDYESDPSKFKADYQLQSIFKRYRFESDLYSDQELTEMSIKDFHLTQDRLALVNLDSLPDTTQRVLDYAASYVSHVLGPYSGEEHRSLCRFGRKASVGIPARMACEAARWELPISGSREQISWFDSEMSEVKCVQDYWAAQQGSDRVRSTYQETSSLTLTLVPKTFKSLRAIMPNTTIGSYMSFGLGEMMRTRLKRVGLDIRTLQKRHRKLARSASRDNKLVTADLSKASDSITDALVKRLFPPDWYEILCQSRIREVSLPDKSVVQSLTFCTMGIGYTFPLQTLVFLSLLKAIEAIMFRRRGRKLCSVYGDDMIYHRRLHTGVMLHFERVGFVLNVDKTFCDRNFRESCGGDYFHGVDVRPFQPRNGSAFVSAKTYEAVLYKFVNGLLARWSEYEIGSTLKYLLSELEAVAGKCKLVPSDFPDDSGIKCASLVPDDFLRGAKCSVPKSLGHGLYRFSYLRLIPETRKEVRHEPFLWAGLRETHFGDQYSDHRMDFQEHPVHRIVNLVNEVTGVSGRTPQLITVEDSPIETFRSKLTGRRLRRQSTVLTVSHTGSYKRRSGTSCF
jgi:hypothetical protein